MKRNKLMLVLAASFLLIEGCREKTVWIEDSPDITVTSPAQKGTMHDDDSIRIDAVIKPKSGSIANYYMYLMDTEKRVVCNYKTVCEKPQQTITIDTAFFFNAEKDSDMYLHISAYLEDGTRLGEETRFKLIDSKK